VLGYRGTALVGAAVRLGLPELLAAGALGTADLAAATGTDPVRLGQVLRALAAIGVLTVEDGDRFGLSEAGALLHPDAGHPLRGMALVAAELSGPAYGELTTTLRCSAPPFAQRFGTDVFTYLEEHPDLAAAYGASIATPGLAEAVAATHDFAGQHVVDVGGGTGELVERILDRYPTARGTVFDLPAAVRVARERLRPFGGRAECVAGSFHDGVPAGADAYLLCRVLANWPDGPATAILRACRRALGRHGVLHVVELVRPARRPLEPRRALGELDLYALYGGRLRTTAEWRALLAAAGLRGTRALALPDGWTLLRARTAHP
jgi:hypothetical protein